MNKKLNTILIGIALWSLAFPVFALTVSPAKIEITGDPGQTVTGEIELFNEEKSEKKFFTSYENFEPRGDSGSPYFIGAKDGLATWINIEESVLIPSGEKIYVPYSINIPQSAKPGGYFAAIFFGTAPSKAQEGGEVSIGGKIGVLVLLRVSGDIEESGGLIDFSEKNNKKIFTGLPLNFEYRFNNTGGDRVVPKGEIKIKNTLRIKTATLLANENEGSVLPNSIRKFEIIWGEQNKESGFFGTALNQLKDFRFGFYTAELGVVWGESNQTANLSYSFFIIPWQLLIIVFIVLFIIIIGGKWFLKKYNSFIIAKAMQNNNG